MNTNFLHDQFVRNSAPSRIYQPKLESAFRFVPPNQPYNMNTFSFDKSLTALLDSGVESMNPLNLKTTKATKQLTKWDRNEIGEFSFTKIEGKNVVCFDVWGEKRICLPQLLRFVLNDFDVDGILKECSDLKLICDKCNPGQLEILHKNTILPDYVDSCGLIRKSDAERLCKTLMRKDLNAKGRDPFLTTAKRIYVVHFCFGKQRGSFFIGMYSTPNSKCIQCNDCMSILSPSSFVGHTHQKQEVSGVTHWGFDSDNWRNYLKLDFPKNADPNESEISEMAMELDSVKKKFQSSTDSQALASGVQKSPKTEIIIHPPPKLFTTCVKGPLPSNLQQGSPVLVNPENIIPYAEAEKYDREFTPNVCLVSELKRPNTQDSSNPDNLGFRSAFTSVMTNKKKPTLSTETASIQLMRDIISEGLSTDSERTRLLEHFVQFQKVYSAQLECSTAESKRLQEQILKDRNIHKSATRRLELEIVELKDVISTQSKKRRIDDLNIVNEKEFLLRQLREARCPDVHKTRAKYLVAKNELAAVTTERDSWRDKFLEQEKEMKRNMSEGPTELGKRRRLDSSVDEEPIDLQSVKIVTQAPSTTEAGES